MIVPSLIFSMASIDHEERNKEPFARDDRLPETILDLDVEPGRAEDAMDQVLKPGAVDVVQLVGGDDLDVGHQKRRIEPGIGDPPRNVAAGDADLVQHVAMGRDDRMIGFAAQHIDDAACLVPFFVLIGESGPAEGSVIRRPAGSLLQRPLKRPHEQIALGAVVEDHAKPGVGVAVFVGEQARSIVAT